MLLWWWVGWGFFLPQSTGPGFLGLQYIICTSKFMCSRLFSRDVLDYFKCSVLYNLSKDANLLMLFFCILHVPVPFILLEARSVITTNN